MGNTKISLILIYGNSEATLQACVDSILAQNFDNFELICVNNDSSDSSAKIIANTAKKDSRIKLLSYPLKNNPNRVKEYALMTAKGDFVCFLNPDEVYESGYLNNLYFKLNSEAEKFFEIKNNKLYRREIVENSDEINNIIKEKLDSFDKQSKELLKSYKNDISGEFDRIEKSNIETINNKNYELTERLNQLEANLYKKEAEFKQMQYDINQEVMARVKDGSENIYKEIDKIYEYVNSEFAKRTNEVDGIYKEIDKNYKYTEKLVNEIKCQIPSGAAYDNILCKIDNLEKEIITRHVNLKRIIDMSIDAKSEEKQFSPSESEHIDKIYGLINDLNAKMYDEFKKMYEELKR